MHRLTLAIKFKKLSEIRIVLLVFPLLLFYNKLV